MTLVSRTNLIDAERMLNDFFAPSAHSARAQRLAPRIDIAEYESRYEISAELAGVKKEDIQLTVDEGVLKIEAETTRPEIEDGRSLRSERKFGKWARSFSLGDQIHEEDIKASFENGLLILDIPKRAPVEPQQRHITIQ